MRSQTVIYVKWKLTGRIEFYVNLGKLYSNHSASTLGVARVTLDRKNLFEGYQNDVIEILKAYVK
jgi:hypothetical protein